MQSDCKNSSNNPPIFSPASDASALLFALLPCVHESFLPLFRFLFLFLELSGQNFSKLKLPPVNSSPSDLLDAVFPNKDTLLKSLSFYGSLFRMPLLNTLSGLLQAMQFYDAYKDIFAGFSSFAASSGGSPFDAAKNDAAGTAPAEPSPSSAPASGFNGVPLEALAGLGGMSPEALAGLMGMFSGTTPSGAPVESGAVDDNNSDKPVKGGAFGGNNSGIPAESGVVDDNNSDKPIKGGAFGGNNSGIPAESGAVDDNNFSDTPVEGGAVDNSSNYGNSGNNSTSGNSGNFQDNSNTSLFQDLYKMLTPEQQAIYEKLMQE